MYVFSTNKYLIKDRHIILQACNAEILVASLSRFLLVEIPGKQKYTYLVIVNFLFKRVNVDDIKKKILISDNFHRENFGLHLKIGRYVCSTGASRGYRRNWNVCIIIYYYYHLGFI